MIYNFGPKSLGQFRALYPWLQLTLTKTLLKHDFSIDQGGRAPAEQQALFDAGRSHLAPPRGKHLYREDPSGQFGGLWAYAADVTPFIHGRRLVTTKEGFGPAQKAQFSYFLATAKGVAEEVLEGTGWVWREGINWDMDAEILTDQKFQDWFHVELVYRG